MINDRFGKMTKTRERLGKMTKKRERVWKDDRNDGPRGLFSVTQYQPPQSNLQ